MEDNDTQLQLKKRSRRRLVGAVAFAGLAAVALPMIMDHEPKQASQDVEIRIPGQDEKPFAPKFAASPAAVKPPVTQAENKPNDRPAEKPVEKIAEKPAEKPPEKAAEKPAAVVAKVPEKPAEKLPTKAAEKPAAPVVAKAPEKAPEKTGKANDAEAQRAAAILAGKSPDTAANGEYVILIGAFTNQANVKNLQSKLGELGIKVYTESLDTPQGKKTRVRAGPFPSRDAGEKALDKMKRIGVAGVLAAKQ